MAKLAVVFSFGTALAETAVLATLRLGFGQMVRTGPHVVWVSSVANLAVLGVVVAVLWAVGTKWKRLRTPAVVVFVFALLAVDAIIHRLPVAARADSWAKWLLVGGAADAPVALRDIAATVLDLVGANDDELGGKTLARRWLEPGSAAAPVYSEVAKRSAFRSAILTRKPTCTRFSMSSITTFGAATTRRNCMGTAKIRVRAGTWPRKAWPKLRSLGCEPTCGGSWPVSSGPLAATRCARFAEWSEASDGGFARPG